MINKQGLWFLTLFSLILVLSIYYITMPNEIFENEKIQTNTKSAKTKDSKKTEEVNSANTSYIETLKVELDSERSKLLDTLQEVINDDSKNTEDKNNAYEQMKEINNMKAAEENIIKTIKKEYSLNAYAKQEDNNIEIVIDSDKHNVELANKIMKTVQQIYSDPMNISIKFS